MKIQPTIVYEDDDVVVVNKPARFLTIPDRFKHDLPNVLNWLKAKREEVFVVHRLDKETSGIICFAKNSDSHKHLSKQFQERTADKIYLALLDGILLKKEGEINQPIAENMAQRGKMLISKRGKSSLTLYKVKEEFKNFTLVEATIKTGRTHQIRVHFQFLGHPLAVDHLYGRREGFLLSSIKGKKYRMAKEKEERAIMSRSTLHAHQLTFEHPTSGERVSFSADLPKDFAVLVKQLRKWGR